VTQALPIDPDAERAFHEQEAADDTPVRLLRIQEAAAETGLTARAIRYYEELGLLAPAARSEGDYRLYDVDDLERLRFIRGLRDDAGFSLADIRQLLEDEDARARQRARFSATQDLPERREIILAALAQVDRQVGTLRDKIARLQEMVDTAETRREHLRSHLHDVEAGRALTHQARREPGQ
jgi:MerR family transcriptional regulator, repressor of the yfmOP operon